MCFACHLRRKFGYIINMAIHKKLNAFSVVSTILFYFICLCEAKHISTKEHAEDLCFKKLCKAGRECIILNKEATCQCIEACPTHQHLVCGNDERTYHNPCELHRTACIESRHIKVMYKGPCIVSNKEMKIKKMKNLTLKPVKCSDEARIYMRKILLMDLMLKKGRDRLATRRPKAYFKALDHNKDMRITSDEVFHFLQHNRKGKTTDISKGFREKITCIDAIIFNVDHNKDFSLDFDEFKNLLKPELVPFKEGCEMKGKRIAHGESMKKDCNTCVCLDGKMACSAYDCTEKEITSTGKIKTKPSKYQRDILKMIKELLTNGKKS